jgi:lipoprotein-anchoring transpeptidase ErfK/SrfK
MRLLASAVAFLAFALTFSVGPASAARVEARIDISTQTMTVLVDGAKRYVWKVSTGKRVYGTPTGSFSPKSLKRHHFSDRYDDAPMPHSIFFTGGYAIHGTGAVGRLGRPVSHGCVRLAPGNAATLFALVKANRSTTRIVVTR